MKEVNLYKYTGSNGVIVTTIDLGIECEHMKRLVAEHNKILVKGNERYHCIDVPCNDVDNWTEEDILDSDLPEAEENA